MEKKFEIANELLLKEEFLEKLKAVENDEECRDLFRSYGADLTLEDVRQMVVESQALPQTVS